jgi:hypothetical protein
MSEARFSQYMSTFIARPEIAAAFPRRFGRQVNVLRQQEFPLLAYWSDAGERAGDGGSDGEHDQDVTYLMLVAVRLGEDQRQDVELGKLVKVIKDLAGAIEMPDGVDFTVGNWETDNNADDGDGKVVWASFPVTLSFTAPPDNY